MGNEKIKIRLKTIDDVKLFVKTVNTFKSDIDIITERAQVDAKSVLGVFSLDLLQNMEVRIISNDLDECEKFKKAMEVFKS